MPRYAQMVMGPAGSGKSTYCDTLVQHAATMNRTMHVINLDPAAENFNYPVTADVRELIQVDDCMEDDALRFGPNGGLIFCMEYLAENLDWLQEQLDEGEDDYFLFDCPGQIELYTHVPVMKKIVDSLQNWNFRVCSVFIIDAQFLVESAKFVSGMLSALSCMVNLETSHVNVMTKVDLLGKKAQKEMERFLDPDLPMLLAEELDTAPMGKKFKKMNHAIASVIEDYSLVRFIPLNREDEDSITDLLLQIDNAIQYGEDMLPKEIRDIDEDSGIPSDED